VANQNIGTTCREKIFSASRETLEKNQRVGFLLEHALQSAIAHVTQGLAALPSRPVSYTHLDVYKRQDLRPPLGTFFVEGNHEEFRDPAKYLEAVRASGVRVLNNEKADIDGLQILGVPYRHATHEGHFRSVLEAIGIDQDRASVLLTHAPDHVAVAEAAGVGLQVSGHTHLGQFIPYTWIAARIYQEFVYGLNRIGKMLVYTSSGAGTWGPPLRVGSQPEIVLFEFE